MRSSMRKKMSKEKQDLKAVVDKLNTYGALCGNTNVCLEEVTEGIFPWSETGTELGNIQCSCSILLIIYSSN